MSYDFVADDGKLTVGKPAQEILPAILETANRYFEKGELVIFCNDCHEEEDKHFDLWPPHAIKHTKGIMPYGALMDWYDEKKGSDFVIFLPKSEYDSFYKTALKELLRSNEIEHVRVAGVCTDICVFHTLYGAYKAGFKTSAAKAECATFTPYGDAFLENARLSFKTEVL